MLYASDGEVRKILPSEADARARRGSTVASAFDLSIVLGLLVLLGLWWGLVSLLGVFMTTELARLRSWRGNCRGGPI
jgi:hypothetical protein